MYQDTDNWPRHADGRRKMIGEMTPQEQHAQFIAFARKLDAEFARIQEQTQAALRGVNVNQCGGSASVQVHGRDVEHREASGRRGRADQTGSQGDAAGAGQEVSGGEVSSGRDRARQNSDRAEIMRSAGHILRRADAARLMRGLRDLGATSDQIASAINERFAPLLDEGREVTKGMVAGKLHRYTAARDLARKLQTTILMRQGLTRAEALEQVG